MSIRGTSRIADYTTMTVHVQSYDSIHHLSEVGEPTVIDLEKIVQTFPVIDNHAHNLIREDEADNNHDYPFETITSEAQGHALQEHVHSTLAHIRAVKQLAEFYNCNATVQDVKTARHDCIARDYHGLMKRCLVGTHALLIDDGLPQESVYPVKWHEQLVPTVKRLVRIEAIAAELLELLVDTAGLPASDWPTSKSEAVLLRFNTSFRKEIRSLASDPSVCGFKSVVCYRSGLDVSLESRNAFRPHQSLANSKLLASFHTFLHQAVRSRKYRIQHKEVNDFLVVAACDVLDKLVGVEGETLPIQFHTGLGDNDIDLVKANPAYMQPLIAAFPNVDFVILHASYPYTREAGYLAANYANVWLDIGEVFPMLSRTGQEEILRQALELTPASKILWSTDGHFHPETFYLANRQFRVALHKVLTEFVLAEDVTVMQAINMAVDIMFWNSNALYKLDEERKYSQLLHACGRVSTPSSLKTTLVDSSNPSQVSEKHAGSLGSNGQSSSSALKAHRSFETAASLNTRKVVRNTATGLTGHYSTRPEKLDSSEALPMDMMTDTNSLNKLNAFLELNPEVKYVWVQFQSNTGTVRARMMTVKQFKNQLKTGQYLGVTSALSRLLQNEMPADGCIATGEFKLLPDLNSLCLNKYMSTPSATVQTWWMLANDATASLEHYEICPRWALQRQADEMSTSFNLDVLIGFEVEVVFMMPIKNADGTDFESFEMHNTLHHWAGMTYSQLDVLPMIYEIQEALAEVGIEVEHFHAEAAPGQWEFPLPALPAVQAVDALYKARDLIGAIARRHNLKATVYPRPFPMAPGTACHAHFSINGTQDHVQASEEHFLAGVLARLPAIMAFSLPIDESYERIQSHIWAGGEWITWGTQNKEVPIRKCGIGHWEFKACDGMGNMYLAMAALIAAGLEGLRNGVELTISDTGVDVSTLSSTERAELGITERLPNSLSQSTAALDKDQVLRQSLGNAVIDDYLAVKRAEKAQLDAMQKDARRTWLIARY